MQLLANVGVVSTKTFCAIFSLFILAKFVCFSSQWQIRVCVQIITQLGLQLETDSFWFGLCQVPGLMGGGYFLQGSTFFQCL